MQTTEIVWGRGVLVRSSAEGGMIDNANLLPRTPWVDEPAKLTKHCYS